MNKQKLKRLLIGHFSIKRLLRSIIFVYVSLAILVYIWSDRAIFPARQPTYKDSSEILKIETEQGVCISAVYLPNTTSEFTILFSHGNAEDLGDIRPLLETFNEHGFSILAYDYQGYGTSEGKASENNAYKDIEAAYSYLVDKLNIPPKRIIAYGRSVGGALAIHLACHEEIGGLILESSFVTAFRVVTRIPLLPFDKFRNIDKIEQVRYPVLIIHGKEDQIISLWHGQRLFEFANEPKLKLWIEGAGHNDLGIIEHIDYWDRINQLTNIIRKANVGIEK